MSFKPMVKTIGDPKFYKNGLAFASKEEAENWAKDLLLRWTKSETYRVDESEEMVNSVYQNGRLQSVKAAQ